MNNYRIISDLGSGAYSTVHKAIDVQTGHIVAIKKISDQQMDIKHIISREVAFLHEACSHPNIINLYKCFSLGSYTYLVFQYVPMDLISFYKSVMEHKQRNLAQEEISFISYQLLEALNYLHSKGIMHRDIKPQNILINPETLQIKLIDFGFAKKVGLPINTNYMITRWYRPIQVVLGLSYDQKVDVFSSGALMLELYLGKEVFRSSSNVDQFYWITSICGFPFDWKAGLESVKKLNLSLQTQEPPQLKQIMSSIRPLARDLITKMLESDPNKRISVQQCLNHPYFSRFKINMSHNTHKRLNNARQRPLQSISSSQLPKRTNRAFSSSDGLMEKNITSQSKGSLEKQLNIQKKQSKWKLLAFKGNKRQSQNQVIKTREQYKLNKPFIQRTKPQQYNHKKQSERETAALRINTQQSTTTQGTRNRIRSLNQGIHVVSLKKLKVNRNIDNPKSKQKQIGINRQTCRDDKKISMVSLHPPSKQKPMFSKIKQKINEGNLKSRGDLQQPPIHRQINHQRQRTSDSTKQTNLNSPTEFGSLFGLKSTTER